MPQDAASIPAKRAELSQFPPIGHGVDGAKGTGMSEQIQSETALVLFSGGQDSADLPRLGAAALCAGRDARLRLRPAPRHRTRLPRPLCWTASSRCARIGRPRLGESHTLKIPTLAEISDTALTRDVAIAMGADGLPNTFVPGRNLVFLTFAAALAYRRGITHIVGGMCETDYSGYPDCRDETIRALQAALNLGMDRPFELHTPLMWLDKAATWKLAHDLGGAGLVDLIREHSHTCYLGERGARHDWGYGCGECPACALRAKGWREYGDESATVSRRCRSEVSNPHRREARPWCFDGRTRMTTAYENPPAAARSACRAACGRRRDPRHRGSDAAFRRRRRPCGDQSFQRR